MTSLIPRSTDGAPIGGANVDLSSHAFTSSPLPGRYYSCADMPTGVDLTHGALWIPLTENED